MFSFSHGIFLCNFCDLKEGGPPWPDIPVIASYRSWSSRWFSWLFQAIRARCSSASYRARSSAREPVSSSYFFLSTSSLNSSLTGTREKHSQFTHSHSKTNLQLMVRETCHITYFVYSLRSHLKRRAQQMFLSLSHF